MMFRPVNVEDDLYFVTGSIIEWMPVFGNKEYRMIVLDSLNWLTERKRMKLFAFVIMANHLHWISFPIPPNTINDNIWSFGSFTAHEILRKAEENDDIMYLQIFAKHAHQGKSHKIWRNFLAKNIYSQGFLIQKLDYIHNNPLGRYSLRSRADYPFSSAKYYDEGKETIIRIEDVFDFIDNL